MANQLGAQAFSYGRHIGFAKQAWQPGTPKGYQLLTHELVHVKQNRDIADTKSGTIPIDAKHSHAEQSATQAELTGRAPSTSEPAALRLRRVPLFGFDWDVSHTDVNSGDVDTQLLAVYTQLTGANSAAAQTQVQALVTNLAGGNSALLLHALDFLRDNMTLLPGSLLGEVILLAAQFCGTRSDAPSTLSDEFYRDLLIASMYTAGPGSLVIDHSSGEQFPVPGIQAGQTDFAATGSPTSLQQQVPPVSRQPITGGFRSPLSVTVGFATGARFPNAGLADSLIRSARDRIDPRLMAAVTEVTNDLYVLRALRTFLIEDRGTLVATEDDRGHFDDSSPPRITVGIAGGDLDTRSTLVHELLHYVFDKSDSVVSEALDTSGADHPAIEAIEARYVITSLIRSGQSPLHAQVRSQFGQFLNGTDYFAQMQQAIEDNDPTALFLLANQSDFVTTTVSSGLLPTASGIPFAQQRSTEYQHNAQQYRDLAFMWAQNAVIVRRAMTEAVSIAGRLGIPLADVFARSEWISAMTRFIRDFVIALQRDPRQGVVALEQQL